jgi:hypothetical protein
LAAADGGDDQDALLLVRHLIDGRRCPAAPTVPAELVMGQLTVCIRTFPWQRRTRAVASNVQRDAEKAL